jgi:CHAT domain-containing protein/Tfp pilus assembly protein PilF
MMRMGRYVGQWRQMVALLVLVFGFWLRVPAQSTRRFANDPVYFDYPTEWAVAPNQAVPQLLGYIIARPDSTARILLFVSTRTTDEAQVGDTTALLEAARASIVQPLVEQLIQPLEAMGAQVQRTRTSADIGGTRAAGDRWLVSAGGEVVTFEAYELLLGKRLVIVVTGQPANGAASFAPAWELFRRTLGIGAPVAAAVAAPSPGPSAAQGGVPSMDVINRVSAVLSESSKLMEQVVALRSQGKYSEALPLAERVLTISEQAAQLDLPADMKTTLVSGPLNVLGDLSRAVGDYARAESLLLRAIKLNEQLKGPDDISVSPPLNNLAALYYETGEYDKAEPLFQRAIRISERVKGAQHPDTATAINNLALLYDAKNDFRQAEQLMQRALAIREQVRGPEHEDTAISLSNLGILYDEEGDPVRAEAATRRAIAILEKVKGPDHPDTATAVNNLASLYRHKGDYPEAERLYQRALASSERAFGPDHPSVASTLDNIAQLYHQRGDYARAETFYRRALTIRERAFGPDNPDVAQSLSNLAFIRQEQRDYTQAEQLILRARAIFEKKFGPEHSLVATTLNNQATLYRSAGQPERGLPLAERARAIYAKLFGPDSQEVALALNNLGSLALEQGNAAQALAQHKEALRIYEKIYGTEHPNLAIILSNLSTDYLAAGDTAHAVESAMRGNEVSERQLALALATGSEEQKRLFVATLAEESDYTLYLHAQAAPDNPQALQLALTTILRRKGRVLDAMSDQIAVLRRRLRPEDRALFEKLATAQSELSALVLRGPGKQPPAEYQQRLEQLTVEVDNLQGQISVRSAEFRVARQPVTLAAVAHAIPAGAALVEFALYHPYNVRGKTHAERFGAPRYVAYVARQTGAPVWVSLGDAAPIDQAIKDWRAALANPQRADVRELGRTLDEKLMRPVRKLLGDTQQIFISPDGALNLIPFGALVDEQNRYLVESYSITYLTSGRDLLRLGVQTGAGQGAVVIADPSFDAGGADATAGDTRGSTGAQGNAPDAAARDAGAGRRSFDFASARFTRLPGTAEEGRAISAIMPGLKLLTGAQATEAALKQLRSPAVLHIATHGFFLPDQPRAATDNTRGLALGGTSAAAPASPGENPLLRSGLALAGANMHASAGGEDGVLTALEASGLDLWGTRLVVLSACETGLGDVQAGEGVYGLRRALVLAGSESQVMSLWQVSDAATRDLMVNYYKRLQAGEGRTEGLRQVQLAMIKSKTQGTPGSAQRGLGGDMNRPTQTEDRSHPFYWASFIQSGEWRGMNTR